MADPGVTFDEKTGYRILAAVRQVEQWIRGGSPGRGRWPVIADGIYTMRSPSGGIPPMTGTTAGSAVCTFYDTDRATQALGTRTATVYNDFPAAVDANRKIKVHAEGGVLRFLVQSCS